MTAEEAYSAHLRVALVLALAAMLALISYVIPNCCLSMQGAELQPPSWPHLLGTDRLGRDVMLVTLAATAYSVLWASLVLIAAVVIGLVLALISAAFWKGWADRMIEMLAETLRSFPSLVLALLFLSVGVPVNLMLIAIFWIPVWRVMRTRVAAQRFRPYVLASRLAGHSQFRTYLIHVMPNVTTGSANLVLLLAVEILSVQAGIEFLGFSVPLSRPTLGNVTAEALRLGGGFAWVWLPASLLAATIALILVRYGWNLKTNEIVGLE